jgi:hypothetical protein
MDRLIRLLKSDKGNVIVFAAFTLLFWGLRIAYWSETYEQPFSDMADYAAVGHNIAAQLFFGISEQLFAYYTPVTPGFIAIAKILGGEHAMAVFRVIVAGILFTSAIGLAWELSKLTANRWIGCSVLAITALSKPSIFWGYKYSTETVSEALLMAALAISFAALRRRSPVLPLATGLVGAALFLNRPQFIFGVFLLGVLFGLSARGWLDSLGSRVSVAEASLSQPRHSRFGGAVRSPIVLFVLGVLLVWGPWIGRNEAHYGTLVPFGTSGTEALIWEYGGAPIRQSRYTALPLPNGQSFTPFGIDSIRRFIDDPNGLERYRRAQLLADAWLKANAPDLPALVWWRLKQFAGFNGTNGLTHVSRDFLFTAPSPGYNDPLPQVHVINLLLLDKSPWACIFALVGIAMLFHRNRAAGIAAGALIVVPWFTAALVIGYERTVESLITPLLIFAFYGFVGFASRLMPVRTVTSA